MIDVGTVNFAGGMICGVLITFITAYLIKVIVKCCGFEK